MNDLRGSDYVNDAQLQTTDVVGGPVTCVTFLDRSNGRCPNNENLTILYGQGPFLRLVCIQPPQPPPPPQQQQQQQREEICSLCVGHDENIHGLEVISHSMATNQEHNNSSLVLVFGGRRIAVVEIDHDNHANMLCLVPLVVVDHSALSAVASTSASACSSQSLPSPSVSSLHCHDWIWHCQVVAIDESLGSSETNNKNQNDNKRKMMSWTVWVGLAHNNVQKWHLTVTFREQNLRHQIATTTETTNMAATIKYQYTVQGPTRCISYCLALHVPTCTVALGSVTQGILLWTWTEDDNNNKHNPVTSQVARLTHHKGVIHGLSFEKQTGKYLASASDDRTVRLWHRQTDPETNEFVWTLRWTGWGHTARCWRVALANHGDFSVVISSAEDGTARIWDRDTGTALATLRGHACHNIWSLATHGSCLITGAENGTLALFPSWTEKCQSTDSNVTITSTHPRITTITVPDDRSATSAHAGNTTSANSPPDVNNQCHIDDHAAAAAAAAAAASPPEPKKVKRPKAKQKSMSQVLLGTQFVTGNLFFVATRNGTVWAWDMLNQKWTRYRDWWNPSLVTHNLQPSDGTSMSIHPSLSSSSMAVGMRTGHVLLIKLQRYHDDQHIAENEAYDKMFPIFMILPPHGLKAPHRMEWMDQNCLAVFHAHTMKLWYWDNDAVDDEKAIKQQQQQSQQSQHSSDVAGVQSSVFSSSLNIIVLCGALQAETGWIATGDNRGHVSIFRLVWKLESGQGQLTLTLPVSTRRLHGREHVNDMRWTSSTSLVSIGNDGMLCQSTVDSHGILCGSLCLPVNNFSALMRLLPPHLSSENSYCVAGYMGNTIAVVDSATGYEFVRKDTGGRKRGFVMHVDEANENKDRFFLSLAIAANRKDGLNDISLEQHNIPTLADQRARWTIGIPLHHETIFDVCMFMLTKDVFVIVTGSEDCSSKLLIWSEGRFLRSQQLTPQPSGVRAVSCCLFSDSLSALVVVGGSKLALQFFTVHFNLPNEYMTEPEVRLLGQARPHENVSIDHRINSLRTVLLDRPGMDDTYLTAAGDSNGRVYIYHVEKCRNGPLHGRCIFDSERPVLSLEFAAKGNTLWLLVGSSAGDVKILDLSLLTLNDEWIQIPVIGSYQSHSVGTNSLSAKVTSIEGRDVVLIASGGDDQRLSLNLVEFSRKEEDPKGHMLLNTPISLPEASVSAIRSVHWLEHDRLATVGYGGRLAIWCWTGANLILESSTAVQVGDINGMTTMPIDGNRSMIVVAGTGLQSFDYVPDNMTD